MDTDAYILICTESKNELWNMKINMKWKYTYII